MSAGAPAPEAKYAIAVADLAGDRDAILRIWRQHQTGDGARRYDWMYRDNSLGRPLCLILRNADGSPAGVSARVRRRFRFRGRTLDAGQMIDLVVDRSHRSAGPALQLQRALLARSVEDGLDFLYGTPLRAAELVQRRVGFQVLGTLQRWVKPLRAAVELESRIASAGLRTAAGALIDAAIRLRAGELPFARRGRTCEFASGFDRRFDVLWSTAVSNTAVVGERSADYLKWRFQHPAAGEHRVFCLVDGGGVLGGYVICALQQRTARIADLLAVDDRALRALLRSFSRAMRRENMHYITLHGILPARTHGTLRRLGFFQRPEASTVLVHLNPAVAELAPELVRADNWYFTDADRDV